MSIVALTKIESQKATQLALRHMSNVSGVKSVNVFEGYLEVETSQVSGIAYANASINQVFIDNCIDKESPKFIKGQQLYDDYKKFYKADIEEDDDNYSTKNWMIGIKKHKSFFSVKYEATSALILGNYQYIIGYKEGLSNLEQVFEHLCYGIERIPRG
jgi:hypothetical protein